jgi:1,4-dihydroxy-6-naphthoate synthase
MFWALAERRISTGGRRYVHELADIETLNRRALAGELDIGAVSIHAYAHLADRYALLAHGASMGDGYGPRVVGRTPPPGADPAHQAGARRAAPLHDHTVAQRALAGHTVAVPGELTTAALVLRLYQPAARHEVVPFDQIEQHVLTGRAEFGLLIHEGQLTYAERGLHLWCDLGEWWLAETDLPLPLGGNVVRRDLGDSLIRAVARDLRRSIEYGLAHREEALRHAQRFGRGLDAARTDRFVGMYVNDYTRDYGATGRRAVTELLDRAYRAGLIPRPISPEFVG